MYSIGHIFFILISLCLTLAGSLLHRKWNPPLERMLKICLITGSVFEIIKAFSVMKMIPVVEPVVEKGSLIYRETGTYAPYIEAEDLPFELCSLQLVFIFAALITTNPVWRRRLYAVIYGMALIGGLLAIFLSYIAPLYDSTRSFLLSPRAWEFYLYHSMLLVLAVAIARDPRCGLCFGDWRWLWITCAFLAFLSHYVNSIMSVPVYRGEELAGLTYSVNFLSSSRNPLGILMSEKWHVMLYLFLRGILATISMWIIYLPFLRKRKSRS